MDEAVTIGSDLCEKRRRVQWIHNQQVRKPIWFSFLILDAIDL